MSKQVKQMEMVSLKSTFGEVRDLVLLSISGVEAQAENQMRLGLRKKNIRLHMVKNSLVAQVLSDLGITGLDPYLKGPTTLVWGLAGIADLSKEINVWIRKYNKIQPKAAVADGVVITFDQAKKFPTRAEAIARAAGLALSPASRLVSQLRGPGSRLASQLKTMAEKEPLPAEGAAPAPT
jgi:large subunit ribosomal protein L10